MPVPPPTIAIGEWPHRCNRARPIIVSSDPTCRLSAVGSNPMYAVIGPAASASRNPSVDSDTMPRHVSSLIRSTATTATISRALQCPYARRPRLGTTSQGPHVLLWTLTCRQTSLATPSTLSPRGASLSRRCAARRSFAFSWDAVQPMLSDYAEAAGSAGGHYFHQDLWAARRIHARAPGQHVDIGSRIDGFVSHVLAFMPVTVVDIRPLESEVEGLTVVRGDVCRLSTFPSNSIESLSSLHAIEHIGLGRYGDPILPEGWRAALVECVRVLAPGGRFYLGNAGRARASQFQQRPCLRSADDH